MSLRRILTATFAAVAAFTLGTAALRADTLDDIIKRGTIRVAIDLTAPPFGFQNKDMQADGADVETAKLLADQLGVKLEVVPSTSANRIAYLQSNRVDITMSTLAISPERAKAIKFSSPYSFIRGVILGPKSSVIKNYDDLAGKKISVARGTTNETDTAARMPKGTELIRFDDEAGAMNALASGQVDAYAVGEPLGNPLIAKFPDKGIETKIVLRINYLAVGMRRDSTGLLQWVNTFVMFNQANGELSRIYKKHIGVDMPTLPPL